MSRSGFETISEYKAGGVTAKIRYGQAGFWEVKIFGSNDSFMVYEGYDEERARKAWDLICSLVTDVSG